MGRALYPLGKRLYYPMDKKPGVPQSPYGRCVEQKNLSPTGVEPMFLGRPTLQPSHRNDSAMCLLIFYICKAI